MRSPVRDGAGALLVVSAVVVIFLAVTQLRGRDYLGSTILVLAGLSIMRAGVELLRPVAER